MLNWREPGLPLSASVHVLALVLSAISLSSPKPFLDAQVPSLPVEILTPKEFDQITKGQKNAKEQPTPAQKVEKRAEPVEEDEPDDEPIAKQVVKTVSAPKPVPTPHKEEIKKAEVAKPKPAPEPVKEKSEMALEKAKPEPKKVEPKVAQNKPQEKSEQKDAKKEEQVKKVEAKPQQEAFDSKKIAALLDKRAPSRKEAVGKEPVQTASLGAQTGLAKTLNLSQRSAIDGALRDQVSPNWSPPYNANADTLSVRVRFKLNPDGTLASDPVVVNSKQDGVFRAAADSALRAVRRSAPFKLPKEHYAYWQDVEINFNPKDMFGG